MDDSTPGSSDVTAVVLAGGRAARFGGADKGALLLGELTILAWRVAALAPLVREILLVGAGGGAPAGAPIRRVREEPPGRGPLAALEAGLTASATPWVFAGASDMPFLVSALFRRLVDERVGADAVVPILDSRHEPLCALYHVRCLPAVRQALQLGERRVDAFYPAVRARFVAEAVVRELDPDLRSFVNVNTPEDLEHARILAIRG